MKWEDIADKIPAGAQAKAKEFWDSHDMSAFALPKTFDVPGVEIFAAGKWNGDTYSVEDLDAMVTAYEETSAKIKPYLKLGHGDEQGLLRADELPAAGWISGLRRSGKKLLADFTRVPKRIYDLLVAGAYRKVSSEIFWNFQLDGKKYPRMLKAVALLGGETPAVHDLGDIIGLYSLGGDVDVFTSESEPKKYEVSRSDLKDAEESTMTPEQIAVLQASLSDATTKLAEATKAHEATTKKLAEREAELKKLSDANAAMEKQLSEAKTEKRHAEIKAKIEKLITDKKIVPAQKEVLFALLSNLPESTEKKYTFGEKTYSTLEDVAMAFVDASHPALPTEEGTGRGEDLNIDVTDKAKKYASEHKVSFKDALIAVSAEAKK